MAFSSFSSFSSIQNYSLQPKQIIVAPPIIYPDVKLFAQSMSGYFQNPIGKWYVWGQNNFGQLGTNDTTLVSTPTYNSNLDGFIRITSTNGSSFGLNSSNQWYVWGYNGSAGTLGMNTTTAIYLVPRLNTRLTGFTNIIITTGSNCFGLDSSNQWEVWGFNNHGQLGMGTNTSPVLVPTRNFNLTGFTQIITCQYSAFGLDSSNNWEVWGYNSLSELGMNNTNPYLVPTINTLLNGFTKIITDTKYSVFGLDSNGQWNVWGQNTSGQLGMGNTTNLLTPNHNPRLNGFTQIISGGSGCFGLDSSGNWEVWGFNFNGNLGNGTNGTNTNVSTPTVNSNLNGFTKIILGANMAFGLDSSGNWEVWGNNDYAQLGMNNTTNLSVPTYNSYLSNISNLV